MELHTLLRAGSRQCCRPRAGVGCGCCTCLPLPRHGSLPVWPPTHSRGAGAWTQPTSRERRAVSILGPTWEGGSEALPPWGPWSSSAGSCALGHLSSGHRAGHPLAAGLPPGRSLLALLGQRSQRGVPGHGGTHLSVGAPGALEFWPLCRSGFGELSLPPDFRSREPGQQGTR